MRNDLIFDTRPLAKGRIRRVHRRSAGGSNA